MKLYTLSLLALCGAALCSCVTQDKAYSYFDKNPDELAIYVDRNTHFTDKYGAAYAAKHFPYKPQPPIVEVHKVVIPGDTLPCPPAPKPQPGKPAKKPFVVCPTITCHNTTETVYVEDTAKSRLLRQRLQAQSRKQETLEKDLAKWQKKAKHRLWGFLLTGGFLSMLALQQLSLLRK